MTAKGLSVPLDVNFFDHPKVVEAGERAAVLFLQALCLAKRTLSDGFVSDQQLKRFGLPGVGARADRLEKVGLFHRDAARGGWWIHDFLEHNRSRAEQAQVVQKRKEAGRKGGRPRNQSAYQSEKQAGNPEVKCSEVKNTTTNPRFTQEGRSSSRGGGGGGSSEAAGAIRQALSELHPDRATPPAPTGTEVRSVAEALARGWTPAQVVQVGTEAAARSDLTRPRAWVAKAWTRMANEDPPDPDGAKPIGSPRPVVLTRPHAVDCPGGCDDSGLIDTGAGLAQCPGQPLEATT